MIRAGVVILMALSFMFPQASAQSNDAFFYQAVAREGDTGELLSSQSVLISFSIHKGSASGPIIFEEDHNTLTNEFGLINLNLGSVNAGDFNNIDWDEGPYFLEVEINGESIGTTPFQTVPYSKLATDMSIDALTDVSIRSPQRGDVLKWDGSKWEAKIDETADLSGSVDTDPTDDIIIGTDAKGDLTGSYPDPKVIGIQGKAVSNKAPEKDQILKWDGEKWTPADDEQGNSNGSGDPDPDDDITIGSKASGDLAGNYPDPVVSGLLNRPLGSETPENGQVLTWSRNAWRPANAASTSGDPDPTDDITTSTEAKGDLTGSYPGPEVSGIKGNPVSSKKPKNGEILKWDGKEWSPGPDLTSDDIGVQSPWKIRANDIFYDNGFGGVGIRNASPLFPLDVTGTIRSKGSLVVDSTIYFLKSLKLLNIPDNYSRDGIRSAGSAIEISTYKENAFWDNGYGIGILNQGKFRAGMYYNSGQGFLFADVKNFRMEHPLHPDKEIWYASIEGPEAAVYLRGTSSLKDGKTEISFPEHFSSIVSEGSITVILTPLSGESKGLAVINKSAQQFKVIELFDGKGNYEFDWEVKAVRKGFEDFQPVRPAK